MFNPKFFKDNRKRLLEKTKSELIILTANGLMQSISDETYPFVQDSNFWYLTGIDEPDVIVVISEQREFLIIPSRDEIRVIFEGPINKEKLAKVSGIGEIIDEKPGWIEVKQLLKKRVATLAPPAAYINRSGFYTNPARAKLLKRLKNIKNDLDIVDLRSELAGMRVCKQPSEINALEKAIDISIQAFEEVLSRRKEFKYEYQVEATIDRSFRYFGGDGPAFSTIAASGKNACILHYRGGKNKLTQDELLLIDAGSSFSHYAGDLTRTVALQAPTPRQQTVYDAVLAIQTYALGIIKPGLTFKDYNQAINKFSLEKLKEIGLMKKDDNEQKLRKYCPHGISHFLGLDVHDVADYQPEKTSQGANRMASFGEISLQAAMVLTVEPGIYIPEEGIGIRIEDDILITKSGPKNLSEELSRELY